MGTTTTTTEAAVLGNRLMTIAGNFGMKPFSVSSHDDGGIKMKVSCCFRKSKSIQGEKVKASACKVMKTLIVLSVFVGIVLASCYSHRVGIVFGKKYQKIHRLIFLRQLHVPSGTDIMSS